MGHVGPPTMLHLIFPDVVVSCDLQIPQAAQQYVPAEEKLLMSTVCEHVWTCVVRNGPGAIMIMTLFIMIMIMTLFL